MSAAQDYPLLDEHGAKEYETRSVAEARLALEEIDRLRAEVAVLRRQAEGAAILVRAFGPVQEGKQQ